MSLAAPQIGFPLRAFVHLHKGNAAIVVNPEITERADETVQDWECCASVPGYAARIRRHKNIVVKYMDRDGDSIGPRTLNEADSRLFQHEMHHLDGIMFPDVISPMQLMYYMLPFGKQGQELPAKILNVDSEVGTPAKSPPPPTAPMPPTETGNSQ
jgi:peptide deformylase